MKHRLLGLWLAAGVGAALIGVVLAGLWAAEASHRHSIYYRLLYMVAAKNATAGAITPAAKVDRLLDYVFVNVRMADDAPLDENGSPAETLTWGYGYSDQQVRLFMKLAADVDIPSRELFLIRPTDGSSPLTVAEVQEDGRWNLVDVAHDYAAKRFDGSPATTVEVASTASDYLRLQARNLGLDPSDYQDGKVGLVFGSSRLAALAARLLPPWLANAIQDAYLRLPPPVIDKPVGFSRFQGYSPPDGQLYWRARNYQLFSRSSRATAAYQALLATYPNSTYANDARYYLALIASATNPSQSIQLVDELASHSPLPAVASDAQLVAARSYEALGGAANCSTAQSLYQRLAGERATPATPAFFRLSDLNCGGA